jgi:methionine-rich copper-binding protein CopC
MKTFVYSTLLSLIAAPAFAHSELTASMPADKASVETAPKEVMLHFSEPVRLTALAVTKAGEEHKQLSPLPTQSQKDFSIASPGLAKGQYTVDWRAMSGDAHVMTGKFTFAVGEPITSGAPSEAHGAAHAEHGADHGAQQHGQH